MPTLARYAAFSTDPSGGNPAGVWVGDAHPEPARMQALAAEIGYSETAFVAPSVGMERAVRYFSPEVEVPFCGHATVAAGVALGRTEGAGTYRFLTAAGPVPVEVGADARGEWRATLTSVEPEHRPPLASDVDEALAALGWARGDLDASIPPAYAYAGAWHLVLAVRDAARLARLDYDFDRLGAFMREAGVVTAQLVWRERPDRFHARNPFPVGGVVEDPATGAAAAALGGYLRAAGLLAAPASFDVLQGEAMGRPSRLAVHVPAAGGIRVTGTAAEIAS